jgi:hypothetical protein
MTVLQQYFTVFLRRKQPRLPTEHPARFPIILPIIVMSLLLSAQPALSQGPPKDSTVVPDTTAIEAPPVSSDLGSGDNVRDSTPQTTIDTFSLRTLPDTLVTRWKKDPAFAYANDPAYWTKEKQKAKEPPDFWLWLFRLLDNKAFWIAVYIVLGALLLYFVYRIMSDNNVRLFYNRSRKKKKGGPLPEGQPEEMEEDLAQRLQELIRQKDYRQSTRYLYLIALSLLNEKGLIRWHAETTNQGYLLQLKDTPGEASFRFLTGIYDKVWYGEFPLTETQFGRLHQYFEDFYKTIPA